MSTLWILVTLAAVNGAVLFLMYLYFRRKVRETLELDEVLGKARREVGSLVAELNLAADRSVSLLEDRTAQANAAVERVEKAIIALGREAGKREREKGIYDRLSRARPLVRDDERREAPRQEAPGGAAAERPQETLPAESAAYAREDGAPAEGKAAAGNPPAGKPPLPEISASQEPILTGKSPAERVVDLWRRGFSAEIISLRTGMAVSEINLAIAMEEQRLLWNADREP